MITYIRNFAFGIESKTSHNFTVADTYTNDIYTLKKVMGQIDEQSDHHPSPLAVVYWSARVISRYQYIVFKRFSNTLYKACWWSTS